MSVEEYQHTYRYLNIGGNTIVDIGADYGSSVNYFLSNGATMVYAFESDPLLHAQLVVNFGTNPLVQTFSGWSGQLIPANILKVDCEGCEQFLTPPFIDYYFQFAIALHPVLLDQFKYNELKNYVLARGARMVFMTPDGQEEMYVKTTSIYWRIVFALS